MDLAAVVATSQAVGATRSRSRKVALLADLLRQTDAEELPVAASFLAGRARQGRVSVGWRTLAAIRPPAAATPTLGLADVDRTLDALAGARGRGSRAERERLLRGLLGRATDEEQRWLRGLVIGELRQGALDGLVAQALARAWTIDEGVVRRALMLSGDLGEVAEAAARGGEGALAEFGLTLFRPLLPMLAQASPSVDAALDDLGEAAVEVKLDGARVQLHRSADEVRLYSRSSREITAELPGVVDLARRLPARAVVLDGEALGFDADGRPLPFQDSMQGRGADRPAALRALFFDILHLDGHDLLDAPLAERRKRLARLVPPEALVESVVVSAAGDAAEVLRRVVAEGHEGVVVKSLDAPYEAGRRGAAWRKVKPVHTIDLVVLAVEWGSGRRRGWLSNLHLGARDPDGGGFVMLGKTFKGLTDDMLAWQTERFLALAEADDGHVVRVRPEQVVEVAFDGVQRSSRYPGGLALRFARVRQYREDKSAEEADTIDAVRAVAGRQQAPRA